MDDRGEPSAATGLERRLAPTPRTAPGSRGTKSRLPDLYVTPEPSSLLLPGVAVLLARRR